MLSLKTAGDVMWHVIDADSVCACVCVCVCVRACVRVHVCVHACVCEAVKRPFTAVSSNPRVAAEAHVVSRYRSKRESPSKRMSECYGGHWTDGRRGGLLSGRDFGSVTLSKTCPRLFHLQSKQRHWFSIKNRNPCLARSSGYFRCWFISWKYRRQVFLATHISISITLIIILSNDNTQTIKKWTVMYKNHTKTLDLANKL